jgi:SAM-dependent methyltransferase
MLHDPWLDRWLPLAIRHAAGKPVLEIGCGHGDDTVVLARAGLRVIGFDLSRTAAAIAQARVPSASIDCRDIRSPLPTAAHGTGLVVASLSLHYFPWTETVAIVRRIHDILCPGGLLLCRLNSTQDANFGATGHPEIERDFYSVNGEPKRFFDARSIAALFAEGWKRCSQEHLITRKYVKSKALWEVALEKMA